MLTGGISAVKIVRSWKMTSAEALETGVFKKAERFEVEFGGSDGTRTLGLPA